MSATRSSRRRMTARAGIVFLAFGSALYGLALGVDTIARKGIDPDPESVPERGRKAPRRRLARGALEEVG